MNSFDIMENLNYFENRSKDNPSRTCISFEALIYNSCKMGKTFSSRKEDVNDHPRSASPTSEFTGENIELVRQVISDDSHSTYDEIIVETSLSHGTIERIIHDCLKMKKVTSRWVPHQLTHEQRVKLCHENLAKFQNSSCRLYDIITGDKT